MHITHPASRLVTETHPYRLLITSSPDAVIAVTLELARVDDGVALQAPVRAAQGEVLIDAAQLSAGAYRGELLLRVGEEEQREPVAFTRLPTPLETPFPFAMYAVAPYPADMAEWDGLLQRLQAAGINLICQHMGGMGDDAPYLDQAARHGIRFMPSDNLHLAGIAREEAWLDALLPPAPESTRQLCVNHPEVRRQAAAALVRHLAEYRAHPAFSGLVYYGDDLFLRHYGVNYQLSLACYCDTCRAAYRAQTGEEPPVTTPARRGIVAADDPWLRWQRFRCGDIYGGFIAALEASKQAVDASIQMGLCHGFPQQPFTHIGAGIYGPLTQPTAVVSSYCYPYMRSPRADLICHYALGAMGQRGKPLWMLGAINSNETLYPDWMVYQNYWNMLAAGYQFIGFFAWWDMGLALQRGETARVDEEMAALARCGAHAAWILPTAKHWRVPSTPFAQLYSFTTEAFDLAPDLRGNQHVEEALELARLALRAGVPLEVICEEEILDGRLDHYEVVCLHGVRILPDTVQEQLAAYVARGGTVYLDREACYYDLWHHRVYFDGAIEASAETMIALLAERQPPAVRVSHPRVTVRRLTAGEVDYFVVINNAADSYWGMPFRYDAPAINERDMGRVRDIPVTSTLEFLDTSRWLYDAGTGLALCNTNETLALTLEPSWGRVIAALPCPTATLAVAGDPATGQGGAAHYQIDLTTPDGQRLAGAFTIRVTVTSPTGAITRDEYIALADGGREVTLPIAINDAPGAWRVTFTGGFPRVSITHTLSIHPGARPAIPLTLA